VIAAFGLLCAIYIWAIPPLEGSDEFEHFAYVTWLIEQKSFPLQGEAGWNSLVRQESGQPPLYYWLASLPARLAGTQPPPLFRPNPHFRYELDPTLPDNKNTALHYPADRGGAWRAIYFARAASVTSGALLILCVYGLTRAVLPRHRGAPLAGAAFVAFMPQVIYHSSHVSNDILAAAFSALALWMLARLVRLGGGLWPGLAVGAALGLAALVKVNTLVIGLPIVLALLWLWQAGRPARDLSERTRVVLAAGGGMALGFVAVAGWWFLRSWRLSGSVLGLDTHCYQALSTCGPIGLVWPNPIAWRDTFRSFWAAFGLANVRPTDWVYWLFAGLIVLAALGLARLAWRRRQAQGAGQADEATDPHLPMLLALMGSAIAGNIALLYIWMQQILATYGRLLFPALGGFVVLLIAGLWAIHPRLARGAWLLPAVLAVAAPFWLIRPAYALPRFLDEAAVAGDALNWRYGDFAELLSVTPATRSVAAGDVLPVEVCWRALAPADKNYTVFVQAIGPNNAVVAGRYTYPGLGSYPTAIWEPGRVFCDTIRLSIPADLAQTLVYRLSVGMLDDEEDRRLPGIDRNGNPVPPFVGAVRLATLTPGDGQSPHPVTITWYAAEPVPVDYTVFLHLRDEAGQLVAQADGPPLGGWYPTSWWVAGEWVIDAHDFALPADTPPGSYQLVVGLYDPATGERLGGEYDLGRVEVTS